MDIADLSRLILVLLCVALSGFFSASETAFIALPRARLMHLISIGRPGASRVGQLLQHPEKFLATVLLSNNLVNTGAAVLGTALAVSMIGNNYQAVLAATFGVTLILLVFGEALPKTIAWHRSEPVAFAVSRPLMVVGLTLAPAVGVIQAVTSAATKALGITGGFPQMGEEEIRTLIAAGAQSGTVEAQEAELLEKVFRFGDRQVREIMTPRPEIIWVDRGTTLEGFMPDLLGAPPHAISCVRGNYRERRRGAGYQGRAPSYEQEGNSNLKAALPTSYARHISSPRPRRSVVLLAKCSTAATPWS